MKQDNECPICKGTGKFESPARLKVDTREIKCRLAKELKAKGYSVTSPNHRTRPVRVCPSTFGIARFLRMGR